jgi:hypothetical protein
MITFLGMVVSHLLMIAGLVIFGLGLGWKYGRREAAQQGRDITAIFE